ncbi:MAG: T9SS type A sorting domain-containing protein [Bacteroidetes bacterium]|nr:T9SS type A sorting domain-containing protein [Bacteroidota bacterium]
MKHGFIKIGFRQIGLRRLCFIFLLLLAESVSSQTWLHFDTLNSAIANNAVNDITEDRDGNIWIATNQGVSKFDGINWITYNSSNSPLPTDVCYAIAAQGNIIWIGSVHGLVKIDSGVWTIYDQFNSNIPAGYITDIEIESGSAIWIGTWQYGCARFEANNFTSFQSTNSGLSADNVISIEYQADSNFVWIASWPFGGVSKYDFSGWQTFDPTNSILPTYDVNGVAIDDSNNVWLSTSAGVCRYDGQSWLVFDTSNTPMTNLQIVSKPKIDSHSNEWFASNYMGLVKFDDSNWTFYDTTNSPLTDNATTTLWIDRNGNKWVGTYNGVYVFNDSGVVLNGVPEQSPKMNDITLFPNPANSTIGFQSEIDFERYRLLDLEGRVLRESMMERVSSGQSYFVSVEGLKAGMYLIDLYSDNGLVYRKKITKN